MDSWTRGQSFDVYMFAEILNFVAQKMTVKMCYIEIFVKKVIFLKTIRSTAKIKHALDSPFWLE